jgi:hypothetical protein
VGIFALVKTMGFCANILDRFAINAVRQIKFFMPEVNKNNFAALYGYV